MELTTTPSAQRYHLLRFLRSAGRPVRIERFPVDREDPAALAALARDLRELQERGRIAATPLGWVWRH